jgi:hypothetical protein
MSQVEVVPMDLYGAISNKKWLEHTNDNIDVIALNIDEELSMLVDKTLITSPFTERNIIAMDEIINVGTDLFSIGYPLGLYDDKNQHTIVLRGSLTSANGVDFRKDPFFLGYSSSEVGTRGCPTQFAGLHQIGLRKIYPEKERNTLLPLLFSASIIMRQNT